MKNMVMLLLFALAVGGSSAAVSMYLRKVPPKVVEKDPSDVPVASKIGPDDVTTPHGETGHGKTAHDDAHAAGPDMGVAVRPKAMSVEEILRYGMALKKREELMKQREHAASEQESQIKLVYADIQGEQKEIEGLRLQIKEQLAAADRKLVEMEQNRLRLETERQQHADAVKKSATGDEASPLQQENIKRMSAWFQSMEPAKAAEFLKDLCNDGKLDMAVQLLANFEEREAAKVLSAFPEEDRALVTQITDAFRNYKRPEPEKKKGK